MSIVTESPGIRSTRTTREYTAAYIPGDRPFSMTLYRQQTNEDTTGSGMPPSTIRDDQAFVITDTEIDNAPAITVDGVEYSGREAFDVFEAFIDAMDQVRQDQRKAAAAAPAPEAVPVVPPPIDPATGRMTNPPDLSQPAPAATKTIQTPNATVTVTPTAPAQPPPPKPAT